MNAKRMMLILLLLVIAGGVAQAQVSVRTMVNYGSAFREESWVPVDVFVNNDGSDIEGWVELRTLSTTGALQSPVYRVPAVCPKGSRKRFRIHCHMDHSQRIEVRLYNGSRVVDPIPTTREISPIRDDDYLTLILDQEITDYGFLSSTIITEHVQRRFYRENLKTDSLAFLADYPQCYSSFDAIILGNIDPNRISQLHRNLLREYVAEGGTLVVFTGANATQYRGSWVEGFMGATIGPVELVNEQDLTRGVFTGYDQTGANPARQGGLAALTPNLAHVRTIGNTTILGTRRQFGKGVVVAFAVDSASHLLQDCAGYRNLWKVMYGPRSKPARMNYRYVADMWPKALTQMRGIHILSRSGVAWFLGLYFVIGIVGNWILWSALKRREMAWVCLIGFSAAFTGYAAIFGPTAGGSTLELDRLQIITVPEAGGMANVASFVGMFSNRTTRISADLTGEFTRVCGSISLGSMQISPPRMSRTRGMSVPEQRDPFFLLEQTPPRINDLTVRAREIRVIEVHSRQPLPGHLEGTIRSDKDGLHGLLFNRTGCKIEYPFLLLNGQVWPVEQREDEFEVNVTPEALKSALPLESLQYSSLLRRFPPIARQVFYALCRQPRGTDYASRGGAAFLNSSIGPCIIGWIHTNQPGALTPDRRFQEKAHGTLAMCDVELQRAGQPTVESTDVPVRVRGVYRGKSYGHMGWEFGWRPLAGNKEEWSNRAWGLQQNGGRANVEIFVPLNIRRTEHGQLKVELYWRASRDTDLQFLPDTSTNATLGAKAIEEVVLDSWIRKTTYRLENWRSYGSSDTVVVNGTVSSRNPTQTPQQRDRKRNMVLFSVVGRFEASDVAQKEGGGL